MKTQEEIEKLAKEKCTTKHNGYFGFIQGYTQCQEDMADKIKEAYKQGLKDGYACMPSTNSLNKQD